MTDLNDTTNVEAPTISGSKSNSEMKGVETKKNGNDVPTNGNANNSVADTMKEKAPNGINAAEPKADKPTQNGTTAPASSTLVEGSAASKPSETTNETAATTSTAPEPSEEDFADEDDVDAEEEELFCSLEKAKEKEELEGESKLKAAPALVQRGIQLGEVDAEDTASDDKAKVSEEEHKGEVQVSLYPLRKWNSVVAKSVWRRGVFSRKTGVFTVISTEIPVQIICVIFSLTLFVSIAFSLYCPHCC